MEDGDLLNSSDDAQQEMAVDVVVEKKRWPRTSILILMQEVCERFAYYGLNSLLPFYLTTVLLLSEDHSTAAIHSFKAVAYVCPVIGGILADSFFGKYKVILGGSLLYAAGMLVTAGTAAPPSYLWGAVVGLSLVAAGTGGIKACVASFLGDQFNGADSGTLESAYMMFYWMINLGSFLSYLVIPLLRAHVPPPHNFLVAFSVPAALLLLATGLFFAGRRKYVVVAPSGSAVTSVVKLLWLAIRRYFRERRENCGLLEHAAPDYPPGKIQEVRQVLRVLLVFLPLPAFWSLFDQNGSRWVFQARRLDRASPFTLEADQMPLFNTVFVMALIPLLDRLVYPFLRRRQFLVLPLTGKMVPGMLITGAAFCSAASLDALIVRSAPGSISWTAQLPQYFLLTLGEVMVSPVSLEFAYSEAPPSLKSLMMSLTMLAVAFGNLLVVALAEIRFGTADATQQWPAFLLFAGLMFVFVILFYFLVRNYHYKEVAIDRETGAPLGREMLEEEQDMELTDVEMTVDGDFE